MKQFLQLTLVLGTLFSCTQITSTYKSGKEYEQVTVTNYFDEDGLLISNKENSYSSVVTQEKDCKVQGVYKKMRTSDSFVLERGLYADGIKVGKWFTYHKNDSLKSITTYFSEESEFYGQMNRNENYYPNGKLKSIFEFLNDTTSIIIDGYSLDGKQVVKDGNGVLNYYNETMDTLIKSTTFKNGKKNGVETYFVDDEVFDYMYKDGELIGDVKPYEWPEYEGGINNLRRKIQKSFVIPNDFKYAGFTRCSTIIIQFFVEEDGSISDITAVTNNGFGLEEEGLRVMKKLNPVFLTPVKEHGKYARLPVSLPINVKIR